MERQKDPAIQDLLQQFPAAKLKPDQLPISPKLLEGQVPGLQAVSASGQPGETAAIRIRGIGSISASSSPLYVVDGIPYDGNINAINPNDVESISVLKDATASALYGSRGANGIIVITTKSGKKENLKLISTLARDFPGEL